jgi:hypothetical protein
VSNEDDNGAGRAPEPTLLLAPVLAIVTLIAISVPGWVAVAAPLCIAGWVALVGVWAVMVVRVVTNRRAGRPSGRPFWTLIVLPGFIAIVLFMAAAEIPIRARFNLSRDEMTNVANAVLDARQTTPAGKIGSIPIQSIETNGITVSFLTTGFGSTNRWGYLYAPNGLPNTNGMSLIDIGDDWYVFHEGSGRFPPG